MTGPGTLPNSETQHDENNQNRHRKTAWGFGDSRGLAAPRKGLGVSPAAPPRNRGWPVFGWAWRPGAEVVQEAPAAPRAQVPARPATGAQPPSQGLSRGRRTRLLDGGLTASRTPGRRPWGAGLRDGGHDGGTAARPRGAAATPRPPCDARGINRRRRPGAATQATRTATDGPGRPGRRRRRRRRRPGTAVGRAPIHGTREAPNIASRAPPTAAPGGRCPTGHTAPQAALQTSTPTRANTGPTPQPPQGIPDKTGMPGSQAPHPTPQPHNQVHRGCRAHLPRPHHTQNGGRSRAQHAQRRPGQRARRPPDGGHGGQDGRQGAGYGRGADSGQTTDPHQA
ncbi:hypothetical protein KAURM247S_04470 [Kitasatospora aureofaciens]